MLSDDLSNHLFDFSFFHSFSDQGAHLVIQVRELFHLKVVVCFAPLILANLRIVLASRVLLAQIVLLSPQLHSSSVDRRGPHVSAWQKQFGPAVEVCRIHSTPFHL